MIDHPERKNIRLTNHDYSTAGYYFITICTKDRRMALGSVIPNVGAIINRPSSGVELSEYGKIAEAAIIEIPIHYQDVTVDKYVIMPNHIHLILVITRGRLVIAPTNVSVIIQQLKRYISKQIGYSIWQKSYYDHIIRDEADYMAIWRYIDDNPAKWQEDEYFQ